MYYSLVFYTHEYCLADSDVFVVQKPFRNMTREPVAHFYPYLSTRIIDNGLSGSCKKNSKAAANHKPCFFYLNTREYFDTIMSTKLWQIRRPWTFDS